MYQLHEGACYAQPLAPYTLYPRAGMRWHGKLLHPELDAMVVKLGSRETLRTPWKSNAQRGYARRQVGGCL